MLNKLTLIAAVCAALSGCDAEVRGGEPIRTEVYVLVDLSRTWFNEESETHNREVLEAVGRGAALVATEVEPPFLVQHRVIGNQAYLREPVCSSVYMPGFRRRDGDDERVSRPEKLRTTLAKSCVDVIMSRQPEALTQLAAAVVSIAEEPLATPTTKRFIIVLSDFLEETGGASLPIAAGSLKGVDVLLVYRPLAEDQVSPTKTGERLALWRDRLLKAGASSVLARPDTSLRAAQIVSFLTQ